MLGSAGEAPEAQAALAAEELLRKGTGHFWNIPQCRTFHSWLSCGISGKSLGYLYTGINTQKQYQSTEIMFIMTFHFPHLAIKKSLKIFPKEIKNEKVVKQLTFSEATEYPDH